MTRENTPTNARSPIAVPTIILVVTWVVLAELGLVVILLLSQDESNNAAPFENRRALRFCHSPRRSVDHVGADDRKKLTSLVAEYASRQELPKAIDAPAG